MLAENVDSLHTYDSQDLLKRNGMFGKPPLAIIEPRHPESNPLFDDPAEQAPEGGGGPENLPQVQT